MTDHDDRQIHDALHRVDGEPRPEFVVILADRLSDAWETGVVDTESAAAIVVPRSHRLRPLLVAAAVVAVLVGSGVLAFAVLRDNTDRAHVGPSAPDTTVTSEATPVTSAAVTPTTGAQPCVPVQSSMLGQWTTVV
ncbi:MAG TPA: hypothetical protein VF855_07690, partial [Acidimicrobiales bacterium]